MNSVRVLTTINKSSNEEEIGYSKKYPYNNYPYGITLVTEIMNCV
jgi:hypothetical protein